MELDDLKSAWNTDPTPTNTPDIMDLIHQKSKGPIAALKTAYRRQRAIVIALMATFIASQAGKVDTLSGGLLFWTYIGGCLALFLSLSYSYRQSRALERRDGRMKDHLEQYVAALERRSARHQAGARIVFLLFVVLLEAIPHFESLRMLGKWHALSPWIRFPAYAAFLVFQYFLSRTLSHRRFGRHLDRLKGLLKEVG